MKIFIIVLCIIAIILILISGLLFIPVYVGVLYDTRKEKKRSYIYFKIFKIIPIRIRLKPNESDEDKKEKPRRKKDDGQKEKMSPEKYLKLASSALETYRERKDEIKEIAYKIREKVTFSEFIFDIRFGTGDAAKTGIATGAVWSATSIFTGLADRIFGVEKFYVNVTPCFERKCFDGYFKSILKLRLVNIMIIIYKIMQVIDAFRDKSTANNEKAVH